MRRLGARQVLGTDSGTTALRLAIESAVNPGGVVALPAYGCYDLITAALGASRRVVLYDLTPSTLAPDLGSLREALDAGAEAVVVTSIFGYVLPMPAIAALVRDSGSLLIEDIAQGANASWEEVPLGTWGDFSVLSFGRGKGIGGAGGGALVIRGDAAASSSESRPASSAQALTGVAALIAQAILGHPSLFALPSAIPSLRLGETIYHEPGLPGTLHPLQAALAVASLENALVERDRRSRIAAEIARAVGACPHVRMISSPDSAQPGFLRVGMLADDRTVASLHAQGARRAYPMPLSRHPRMAPLLTRSREMPGSVALAASLASLPCHHRVTAVDICNMSRCQERA